MPKVKKDLTEEEKALNNQMYRAIRNLLKKENARVSDILPDDRTFYEWTKERKDKDDDPKYNYSRSYISNAVKYANAFGCSLDYLCGLSDDPKSNVISNANSYDIQAISNKIGLNADSINRVIEDPDLTTILNDLLSNNYGIFLLKTLKDYLDIAPYGFSFDKSEIKIRPSFLDKGYKADSIKQMASLDTFIKNQILDLLVAYKNDSDIFNTKTINDLLHIIDTRIKHTNEHIHQFSKTIRDKACKIIQVCNGDFDKSISSVINPSSLKEHRIIIKEDEAVKLKDCIRDYSYISENEKEKKDLLKLQQNYKDKRSNNKPLFYI